MSDVTVNLLASRKLVSVRGAVEYHSNRIYNYCLTQQ